MTHNNFMESSIVSELTLNEFKNNIFPFIYSHICGDLFIEENSIFRMTLENGKITNNVKSISKGFSVRKVNEEGTVYLLSSTDVTLSRIIEYSKKLWNLTSKETPPTSHDNFQFHQTKDFHSIKASRETINNETHSFIHEIYEYLKNKSYISNVIITIGCSRNHREIYNEKMHIVEKFRCIWSLHINITLKRDNQQEVFYKGISSQMGFAYLKQEWKELANYVYDAANDLLNAIPVKAGSKTIVCAPGECGTMLHEAVGHALESDFLFNKSSCFSGKKGHTIANSCVTVIDDGTIDGVRGTIEYDDEGTKATHNILIQNGMFTGELSSKFYSHKQGINATGNGRRESFAHNAIPRMTNTYLAAGSSSLQEMITNVKNGIFVKDIGGGQVVTSTGAFVFAARLAYLIENGKVTSPIKGAMLMGNCTSALFNIVEVGNDWSLCKGSGNCGKNGQTVPVCVGCPSFTLQNITIGGE